MTPQGAHVQAYGFRVKKHKQICLLETDTPQSIMPMGRNKLVEYAQLVRKQSLIRHHRKRSRDLVRLDFVAIIFKLYSM